MNDFGKLLTAVITPFDSNGILSTDTVIVGMNYKNERSWKIQISSAVINQPQQSSSEIELILSL